MPEANVKLDLTMNALGNFPTYLQMDSSLLKKKGAWAWRLIRHLRERGKDFVGSTMWEVTKDPSVSIPPVINKKNIKLISVTNHNFPFLTMSINTLCHRGTKFLISIRMNIQNFLKGHPLYFLWTWRTPKKSQRAVKSGFLKGELTV